MATYYVDAQGGSEHADGLSPERAIRDYRALNARAGDRILFRRGGFMRDTLDTLEGEAGAPMCIVIGMVTVFTSVIRAAD